MPLPQPETMLDFRGEYEQMDEDELIRSFKRLQTKVHLLREAVRQDCRQNIEDTPLAESIELYSERYWACERELINQGLYHEL